MDKLKPVKPVKLFKLCMGCVISEWEGTQFLGRKIDCDFAELEAALKKAQARCTARTFDVDYVETLLLEVFDYALKFKLWGQVSKIKLAASTGDYSKSCKYSMQCTFLIFEVKKNGFVYLTNIYRDFTPKKKIELGYFDLAKAKENIVKATLL